MPQSLRLRTAYQLLLRQMLQHEREELQRLLGPSPGALKAHLEWIDRAREATRQLERAAATPFPEPQLAEGFEALQKADHLLQPSLDATAATIDKGIARAGLDVPVETYTCALPTGTFNAQARDVSGGVLVLINSGLISLLFGATQVIAQAASFETAEPIGLPLYTDEQVSAAFASLLFGYLAYGDARESTWFAPQGGIRGQLAEALWSITQVFAVAHEFGHVVGGHVGGPPTRLATPGWENVDVVAKSVEQEREADRVASLIMSHLDGVDTDPSAPSMVAAGPAIFFALARSVELAHQHLLRIAPSPNADHPPPDVRWTAVRAELEQRLPANSFALANSVRQWIEAATARAIDAFARLGPTRTAL